jgi:GTPase
VWRGEDRGFVVADIPGIIEGAADGAGLGLRFLKHVERTRVLLHLVTWDPSPGRELLADFDVLSRELQRFDPALASRPMIVAVSKMDLGETRDALPAFVKALKKRGIEVFPFSAATRDGIEPLLNAVEAMLAANPVPPTPRKAPLPVRNRKAQLVEEIDEFADEAEDDEDDDEA